MDLVVNYIQTFNIQTKKKNIKGTPLNIFMSCGYSSNWMCSLCGVGNSKKIYKCNECQVCYCMDCSFGNSDSYTKYVSYCNKFNLVPRTKNIYEKMETKEVVIEKKTGEISTDSEFWNEDELLEQANKIFEKRFDESNKEEDFDEEYELQDIKDELFGDRYALFESQYNEIDDLNSFILDELGGINYKCMKCSEVYIKSERLKKLEKENYRLKLLLLKQCLNKNILKCLDNYFD